MGVERERRGDKDLTVDGRSMNRMPTSNHRTDHIQEGNVFIRKKQKSCSHFVMREHGFFFHHLSCQRSVSTQLSVQPVGTAGATCLHTLVRALVA